MLHLDLESTNKFPDSLREKTKYYENDWTVLESPNWLSDCELLILHLIGETCGIPHPDFLAEETVRSWCEKGGNILLLHGASAAFWHWPWWREITGFRWVRSGDPDHVALSAHPVKPYHVNLCKTRHKLISKLVPFDVAMDEIYTELEQVSPVTVFMETHIEEGVYPQCFETISPWGGKIISFLPGHTPEVTACPELNANIQTLVQYLMGEQNK